MILKFEKCLYVCLRAISSMIYGPTGTKLGREVGDHTKDKDKETILSYYNLSSVCAARVREEPHWQGASNLKNTCTSSVIT